VHVIDSTKLVLAFLGTILAYGDDVFSVLSKP
jgi:hypothetical protein